ncbi:MAG TPA: YkoF family thiamine/hydroxymethylpyrimidine-binding protein [Flavobacteriaceae bacterium]|jgi:uncharacterized protein YqgV (UPF0045/DUF77 family)|nr:YkoF family thiamine/hydroxymethylpyrimidine-binding protein [Flavobacteriaceae bacterium]
MKVSVDISLYPLHQEYLPPIKSFIETLRKSEFKVLENNLSTQVYGDYDRVMEFLSKHIKEVFFDESMYVFVLKIIKGDRSE